MCAGSSSAPGLSGSVRKVLGYELRRDSPRRTSSIRTVGPSFWFERMDEPRPDAPVRSTLQYGCREQAEARTAAAIAADGPMVPAKFAPSSWTQADAAGNEANIATTTGRDRATPRE